MSAGIDERERARLFGFTALRQECSVTTEPGQVESR